MGIKLAKAMGCTCGFFSLPFRPPAPVESRIVVLSRVCQLHISATEPLSAHVFLMFPIILGLLSALHALLCLFTSCSLRFSWSECATSVSSPLCFAARCLRPSHRHHSLRRKRRVRAQMRRRPSAARYVAWCHGWHSIIRAHNLRRPANISIHDSFFPQELNSNQDFASSIELLFFDYLFQRIV